MMESGQGTALVRGPWGETREVPEALEELARQKTLAVYRANPWLERLTEAAGAIIRADVTHTKRLKMLRALADRINVAVSKQAACRRGCDACCKIQVEMTGWEAKIIGEEMGIKVKEPAPAKAEDSKKRSMDLLGKPCGFLKAGECSIYASRPIACRVHHSLNMDAAMCQPEVNPAESMVPTLNMTMLHLAYAACSGKTGAGDISEFFDEARRGPSVIERCLDDGNGEGSGVGS